MHLCEIEALAVGQDGSGPSPVAEGQLPGAASNSQSRPRVDLQTRPLRVVKRVRAAPGCCSVGTFKAGIGYRCGLVRCYCWLGLTICTGMFC